MRRLTKNLIDSSIEAFILALETINRPSVRYRLEAFCFLFCNAWELLIKAKLLDEGQKIFYKKKRKQPRRSLSLDDCLNRIYTSENNPIKLNVLKIHELRNNAMHLLIPFVPPYVMGLFQAGVLNYSQALQEWFGISLSQRVPLGMMTLVYDFDPKQHSLEYARMRRRIPAGTVRWLTDFQKTIQNQATSLGEAQRQFYIPIDFKLAIVKKPGKADIVLSSGIEGKEALILEVPKDPNVTHPYRQTELVQMVNQKLGGNPPFNAFDFQCIKKVYNVSSKVELCYLPKFSSPQYSEKLLDWIVKQATKNPNFFAQTRRKANVRYKQAKAQ